MKILQVVGARPQLIKAAALCRELKRWPQVEHVLVHSGQHYDPLLSQRFFEELELPAPKHHLGVGGMDPALQLRTIEERLLLVLNQEKPDWVLVYGDTTTTLGGARAAQSAGIPLIHVEAGMRSGRTDQPEEYMRVETDKIAQVFYCTDRQALHNLESEALLGGNKIAAVVGDLMKDLALDLSEKIQPPMSNPYCLLTLHRNFNTDGDFRLKQLVNAIEGFRVKTGLEVVFPIHPRTVNAMERIGMLQELSSRWKVIEPLGYLETLGAIKYAEAVITDSGGVQREAFFLGKKSMVLRHESEWKELVEAGWLDLVDDREDLMLTSFYNRNQLPTNHQFLGDGHAARHILNHLTQLPRVC